MSARERPSGSTTICVAVQQRTVRVAGRDRTFLDVDLWGGGISVMLVFTPKEARRFAERLRRGARKAEVDR